MYRVGFKWSHDDLGLVITTTFGSRRAPDTSLRPAGRGDSRAVMATCRWSWRPGRRVAVTRSSRRPAEGRRDAWVVVTRISGRRHTPHDQTLGHATYRSPRPTPRVVRPGGRSEMIRRPRSCRAGAILWTKCVPIRRSDRSFARAPLLALFDSVSNGGQDRRLEWAGGGLRHICTT